MSFLPSHSRICFVVVVCFSGMTFGQEAGEPLSLVDVLDTDGDGVLSAREITRSAVVIRKLDRDRDGRLKDEELTVSDADSDADSDSAAPSRRGSSSSRSRVTSRRDEKAGKTAIDGAINRAASFYMQKKYEQAGKEVEKAQELIDQLVDADDQEALAELTDSLKRLRRAHTLLSEHEIDLPDLLDLSDLGSGTAEPNRGESSSSERSPREARSRPPRQADVAEAEPRKPGTVSFTKQVAPILVKRCSSCHVKDNKAQLSFASYATLMAGSEAGSILVEGSADESILVDMIEAGDMPAEGDPLPDDELKLIRTWVDEGAVFDGDDEEAKVGSG